MIRLAFVMLAFSSIVAWAGTPETCLQVTSGNPFVWSVYSNQGEIVSSREVSHAGLVCMELPDVSGLSFSAIRSGGLHSGTGCDHRAVQLRETALVQEDSVSGQLLCGVSTAPTASYSVTKNDVASYRVVLRLLDSSGASGCSDAKKTAPAGLIAELWGKDNPTQVPLGWALTDAQGQVLFRFKASDLHGQLSGLHLRVMNGDQVLMTNDALSLTSEVDFPENQPGSQPICLQANNHEPYLVEVEQAKGESSPARATGGMLRGDGIAFNEIQAANGEMSKYDWVTIYNAVGRISDVACIPPGRGQRFGGYGGPIPFRVRFQVMDGPQCYGATLFDDDGHALVPFTRCAWERYNDRGTARFVKIDSTCG
jgi:hypothetical protein